MLKVTELTSDLKPGGPVPELRLLNVSLKLQHAFWLHFFVYFKFPFNTQTLENVYIL